MELELHPPSFNMYMKMQANGRSFCEAEKYNNEWYYLNSEPETSVGEHLLYAKPPLVSHQLA